VGRKLAVGGLTAAVLFFAVAKGDHRVAAKTVMEAGIRQATVAPLNGYLAEAPVRAGDLVRPGQLLCALDDREMRLERRRWLSQQEQLLRQHQQALATRNSAQVKIVQAQIDQARAQIALLDDQIARTCVVAPFEGVVVAGDLSQSIGVPAERGQVLFEVAPLSAYRAVLQVDERDIAGLAVGQRG
jgi:multidrug resistance efflux pump